MAKKTRNQLKDLFKPGAKPSGDDFSDFIESTFNIQDDGLEKPVGADAPLKIKSYGAEENLLDFYAGDSHSWRINQKPSAATAASGLNFAKADGSSKLFIANSGNVGIGTDSPNKKLEVIGTVKAIAFEGDGANLTNLSVSNVPDLPASKITSGTMSGSRINSLSANKITTGTLTGSLIIDSKSITSPGTMFQVKTNNGSFFKVYNFSTETTNKTLVGEWVGGGNTAPQVRFSGPTNKGFIDIGQNSNGDFVVEGSDQPRLVVQNSGNVGIGVTNPSEKLVVDGSIRTDNAIINNGGQSGIHYAAFSHKDGGDITTYALLHYSDGTTYLNASAGKNLYFRVNNATKMIVKSGGNVGIGVTNPGQKLEVSGTVKATAFEGNGENLTNLSASKITSGTMSGNRIASLSASKITSGTLIRDRLPKLFKMQTFTTVSTGTTVNTDVSSNLWEAAIIGFDSSAGDIYEGQDGARKIMKMYMSEVSSKWVVNADFSSHHTHETWTVYVMFIRKSLVE